MENFRLVTSVCILLTTVFAEKVDAEGWGIIKKGLENGKTWPQEGVTKYTHLLECDYRHNFPRDEWTYTYDIRCMEIERGKDDVILSLSVNYDNNVFDTFEVTSCKLEDVIKSIFPPKQKPKYLSQDKPDYLGRPTISYLKYKTEDGKCFARKYQYRNRVASAAKRFEPEEIQCEGKPGLSKYGEVAEFTNCRVPKLPLSEIVTDWSQGAPEWTPYDKYEDKEENEEENDEENEKENKHERLLECTFDQYSKLYDLTCVKGDKADEYFVFVTYQKWLLDRFTVTTCDEDDIVNGIFPAKETTANPKPYYRPGQIWFSGRDGKCYYRLYSGSWQDPTEQPCPSQADKWTNPTWGKAGIWRECKGPRSIKEMTATESHSSGDTQ